MKRMLSWMLLSATVANAWANTAVVASNKVGLKLAKETVKEVKGKNFMVSPVSLQQALSLASNGAAGATRTQLEKLMGSTVESINVDGKSLVSSISLSPAEKKKIQERNSWLNPAVVQIQNGIWNTNGKTDGRKYAFSDVFKSNAKEYYGAEAASLDFKAPGASKTLNDWAKEKTYGLIPSIIDDATLKDMLWVIMNATYIEASWVDDFYNLGSQSPIFTTADNKKVKSDMIKGKQDIGYKKLRGGEIVSIPFNAVQGEAQLDFVVYLPKTTANFAKVQDEVFTGNFLASALNSLTYTQAYVTLPKFSFNTSVEMTADSNLAKNTGLNFLFQDFADFGFMGTRESLPSKVGLIKQNSRIELDEKGVKAAAVTLIGGIETSVRLPPELNIVVDRAFVFAIVERTSKSVLFVGSVTNPAQN